MCTRANGSGMNHSLKSKATSGENVIAHWNSCAILSQGYGRRNRFEPTSVQNGKRWPPPLKALLGKRSFSTGNLNFLKCSMVLGKVRHKPSSSWIMEGLM